MTEHDRVAPPFPGASFDVVALAASAGGLRALINIVEQIPRTFPAALLVVQHLDPRHRSLLPEILARRTTLRVKQAEIGDTLQPGTLYTAPPDRHLLVGPGLKLLLSETAPVHFVRPAADRLFESLALICGGRALAVILTGTGSDGSPGVEAIKAHGGTVVVEDPRSAEFPGMPQAAIRTGGVDLVLPLAGIAPALWRLVAGKASV